MAVQRGLLHSAFSGGLAGGDEDGEALGVLHRLAWFVPFFDAVEGQKVLCGACGLDETVTMAVANASRSAAVTAPQLTGTLPDLLSYFQYRFAP